MQKTQIETVVWCECPGKARQPVHLAIGFPEPDPLSENGDYRCPVSITGFDEPRQIHGVDALQAMSLAVNFVTTVLRCFQQKGYRFFLCPADTSAVDLPSALTGGFGAVEEKIANNQVDIIG